MRTSKLRLAVVFAGLFGVSIGVSAERINIGAPNWISVQVTAEVLRVIANEHLGHESDVVIASNPIIWKAMDKGRGDIDVHAEVWLPNQNNLKKAYVEDAKTVALAAQPYEAAQGYIISKMTQEKYGIKTVEDLINPDLAAAMDSDGNGKGEIYVGAVGWASTNVEKVKLRDYGLLEFYEPLELDEPLFLAKLDAAIKKGQPIFGFWTTPHHIYGMYDLAWVEEPKHDPEKFKMVQPTDDPEWYEKSHVASAWPPTLLHITYAKSLEERAPDFVKLVNNIQLDADTVSAWTFAIAVDKKEMKAFAKEWVDANMDRVNKWLGL